MNKEDKLEDLEYFEFKLGRLILHKRKREEQAEMAKIEIAEIRKQINQLEREIRDE